MLAGSETQEIHQVRRAFTRSVSRWSIWTASSNLTAAAAATFHCQRRLKGRTLVLVLARVTPRTAGGDQSEGTSGVHCQVKLAWSQPTFHSHYAPTWRNQAHHIRWHQRAGVDTVTQPAGRFRSALNTTMQFGRVEASRRKVWVSGQREASRVPVGMPTPNDAGAKALPYLESASRPANSGG